MVTGGTLSILNSTLEVGLRASKDARIEVLGSTIYVREFNVGHFDDFVARDSNFYRSLYGIGHSDIGALSKAARDPERLPDWLAMRGGAVLQNVVMDRVGFAVLRISPGSTHVSMTGERAILYLREGTYDFAGSRFDLDSLHFAGEPFSNDLRPLPNRAFIPTTHIQGLAGRVGSLQFEEHARLPHAVTATIDWSKFHVSDELLVAGWVRLDGPPLPGHIRVIDGLLGSETSFLGPARLMTTFEGGLCPEITPIHERMAFFVAGAGAYSTLAWPTPATLIGIQLTFHVANTTFYNTGVDSLLPDGHDSLILPILSNVCLARGQPPATIEFYSFIAVITNTALQACQGVAPETRNIELLWLNEVTDDPLPASEICEARANTPPPEAIIP